MENQIPAPSFPEQNNANSPQPVPAGVAPGAPLGAAPAGPALGVAPANVRDRDDSYQRIPATYRVSTAAPTVIPPATSAAPATSTPSVRSAPPWVRWY